MKDVQCYELFGGIALKNHAFLFFIFISSHFANSDTSCQGNFHTALILSQVRRKYCNKLLSPERINLEKLLLRYMLVSIRPEILHVTLHRIHVTVTELQRMLY